MSSAKPGETAIGNESATGFGGVRCQGVSLRGPVRGRFHRAAGAKERRNSGGSCHVEIVAATPRVQRTAQTAVRRSAVKLGLRVLHGRTPLVLPFLGFIDHIKQFDEGSLEARE